MIGLSGLKGIINSAQSVGQKAQWIGFCLGVRYYFGVVNVGKK